MRSWQIFRPKFLLLNFPNNDRFVYFHKKPTSFLIQYTNYSCHLWNLLLFLHENYFCAGLSKEQDETIKNSAQTWLPSLCLCEFSSLKRTVYSRRFNTLFIFVTSEKIICKLAIIKSLIRVTMFFLYYGQHISHIETQRPMFQLFCRSKPKHIDADFGNIFFCPSQ